MPSVELELELSEPDAVLLGEAAELVQEAMSEVAEASEP